MGTPLYPYSIPVLIKTVFKNNTSGELKVKQEKLERSLYFIEGKLVFAITSVWEERLGSILLNTGTISAPDYEKLEEMIAGTDEKIGQLLVRENVVSQAEIFRALLYQVRTIGLATMLMDSGEWDFIHKEPRIPDNTRFPVELPGIIAEGVRKINDLSFFIEKFSNLSLKQLDIPESVKSYLTSDEIHLHAKMADCQNRSHSELITSLNIEEELYWEKLVLFFLINILDFIPRKVEPVEQPAAQETVKKTDLKTVPEKELEAINESNPKERSRKLFLQACSLYQQKKYWEAASLLETVVKLDDTRAKYFYQLGLCQSQVPSLSKQAEENFQKASSMQPWNADPIYALGILYKKANLRQLSVKYFRKALEINIDHTKAGKMIESIEAGRPKKWKKSRF